ncbi:MAG: hypothetical protein ACUVSM_08235 [Armatimonadota bacterium]|jgi:hypothetical protein
MATEPNALTDAISEALALGRSDLNEACTCQWIIMPLLQAAGYSLYDIQPQQTDPAGKIPDYTILPDSEHTWFLEAKAWGVALNDQHAQQALIYAYTNNRRWVVLTNGREWRLYDNSIPGELSGKLVAKARLEDVDDVEEFLTAIGRQSVTDGTIERYARDRLLRAALEQELCDPASDLVKAIWTRLKSRPGLSGITRDQVAAFFSGRPPEQPGDNLKTNLQRKVLDEDSTFSVPRLDAHRKDLVTNRKPAYTIMADGTVVPTTTWKDVAVEIVRWLGLRDRLPNLPWVGGTLQARYFLNSQPKHPKESAKHRFEEVRFGEDVVYMDKHRSGENLIFQLIALLKSVGADADAFRVKLRD